MSRARNFNRVFKLITFVASISILVVIGGIFVTLITESLPAIRKFGLLNFLTSREWNYNQNIFGAFRPLSGTLLSTCLALLVAVPVSIATAIFLTELCPHKLKGVIGTAIELLAAIPSIIYGMWGLFVFAPFLESYVMPLVSHSLGNLPKIGSLFQSRLAGGVNLFTASMVLAVMIMPFITSVTRDAFNQVPSYLKESSRGLGATLWETIYLVQIPYSKTAISGGIIIAMGRALGETMAVAYVIGNRHAALDSIFSPYTTITSVMANEFNEAEGIQLSSLFTLALVLFLANFLALYLGKKLLKRKI
ncbi:MAG: phosphate ABC transporter permease subunit PstC [Deltaproteobacteria bacterium]|jgi:phosphate transport system permease protein|nr:phosphate ABC transporter permease subunit PstC [Deltaproteobacteria bacterium]